MAISDGAYGLWLMAYGIGGVGGVGGWGRNLSPHTPHTSPSPHSGHTPPSPSTLFRGDAVFCALCLRWLILLIAENELTIHGIRIWDHGQF
ncbi:MAG: hypothetical protein RMX96_16160 [Nostoc sp. ChiSLP02]|nr:hypothetical protein [Nostoc sp. ChiSLP02]